MFQEMDRTSLGSLDRDMSQSLTYAIKACELNIPQSCANVSRLDFAYNVLLRSLECIN